LGDLVDGRLDDIGFGRREQPRRQTVASRRRHRDCLNMRRLGRGWSELRIVVRSVWVNVALFETLVVGAAIATGLSAPRLPPPG